MTVQKAIEKLTTDPKGFLKSNCVMIAGGTTRPPGSTIFGMTAGTTQVKKKVFGRIIVTPNLLRYVAQQRPIGGIANGFSIHLSGSFPSSFAAV